MKTHDQLVKQFREERKQLARKEVLTDIFGNTLIMIFCPVAFIFFLIIGLASSKEK